MSMRAMISVEPLGVNLSHEPKLLFPFLSVFSVSKLAGYMHDYVMLNSFDYLDIFSEIYRI